MEKIIYLDEDFNGFLEDLIRSGRIDGKEAGITKRCIDKGYDKLSNKQKYVFDRMIEENSIPLCERCGIRIPWSEMLEALENGGYCNWCQHMMEKDKEDDENNS